MNTPVNLSKVIATTFLFIFVLLIPFFIFLYLDSQVEYHAYDGEETTVTQTDEDWTSDPNSPQYVMITRFALLSLVVAFGAIGSLISLLTRNQKSMENLKAFSTSHLFVLQCVGATFALLLMLFFWGGLISGSLFPNVSLGAYISIYSHSDLGKLLVWSFVAGFSERLIPQLIDNILQKINIKSEDES